MSFAQVYIGCKCGETWQVARHAEIDSEKDKTIEILYCTICNTPVTGEKMNDGVPEMHALTQEDHEFMMRQAEDDLDPMEEYSSNNWDSLTGDFYE